MPHQRRQVVDRDGHADMVDRGIGQRLDRAIRPGAAAEQPDIPGASLVEGAREGDRVRIHVRSLGTLAGMHSIWKWVGLAGVAGVVAGGALVARDQRRRNAYTPDDIRARLHQRLAEIREEGLTERVGGLLADPGDPAEESRVRSRRRCPRTWGWHRVARRPRADAPSSSILSGNLMSMVGPPDLLSSRRLIRVPSSRMRAVPSYVLGGAGTPFCVKNS